MTCGNAAEQSRSDGASWQNVTAQLHIETGRAELRTPLLPALPPSNRRYDMNTPSWPPQQRHVAPGWAAADIEPRHLKTADRRRFAKYVAAGASEECWSWIGSLGPDGYGRFKFRGRNLLAHRLAWALHWDFALEGQLTIDHLCAHRSCVNPAHLERVTHHENIRRKHERLGHRITGARQSQYRPPTDELEVRRGEDAALAEYRRRREHLRKTQPMRSSFAQDLCSYCDARIDRFKMRKHEREAHGVGI